MSWGICFALLYMYHRLHAKITKRTQKNLNCRCNKLMARCTTFSSKNNDVLQVFGQVKIVGFSHNIIIGVRDTRINLIKIKNILYRLWSPTEVVFLLVLIRPKFRINLLNTEAG